MPSPDSLQRDQRRSPRTRRRHHMVRHRPPRRHDDHHRDRLLRPTRRRPHQRRPPLPNRDDRRHPHTESRRSEPACWKCWSTRPTAHRRSRPTCRHTAHGGRTPSTMTSTSQRCRCSRRPKTATDRCDAATSQRRASDSPVLERERDRSPSLTLRHVTWGTPRIRRASAVLGATVALLGSIAVLSRPSNGDAVVATQPSSTTTTATVGVHQVDATASVSSFTRSACESLSASGWIGGLYTTPAASTAHAPGTRDTAFSPADCLPTPQPECPPGPLPGRGDG